MGLWLTQTLMTLAALGHLAFGADMLSGGIGAALFVLSVTRSVRRLKLEVVQGV